jgi:molybdopterin converting factor small subunit
LTVTFELFGIARTRAGVASTRVQADTLGVALRALAEAYPALDGEIVVGDRTANGYLVSLGGERFIDDPAEALPSGARLLLLSGQAGG